MERILALDDIRWFPNVDVTARTIDDAIESLVNSRYDTLYLDHDLGEGKDNTGYQFLKDAFDEGVRLPNKIVIVSSNPVGRENMAAFLCNPLGYTRLTSTTLVRKVNHRRSNYKDER